MRRAFFAATAAAGLLAFVARVRQREAPTGLPIPPPLPSGNTVTLAGRGEVFYRDTGPADGPTFLLVHGWSVSADVNWSAVYEPLARLGRVVAPDLRGHGRSLRSGAAFRLDDAAEDLGVFLDVLGIDRVVVIGYSMGGPVAQLFARQYPDRVTALVLAAAFARFADSRREIRLAKLLPLSRFIIRRVRYATLVRLLRGVTPERLTPEWLAGEIMRWDVDAVTSAAREILEFDSSTWLGTLPMPTAVLVTTRDGIVVPAKQRRLAELLRAPSIDVALDHDGVAADPETFVPALREVVALATKETGGSGDRRAEHQQGVRRRE